MRYQLYGILIMVWMIAVILMSSVEDRVGIIMVTLVVIVNWLVSMFLED